MERLSATSAMEFPVVDPNGIDEEHMKFLDSSPDRVEVLVMWFEHVVIDHMHSGIINVPAPILTRVFQELNGGMVRLKSAMKIRQIPVPYPMVQVSFVLLIFHWMCTPIIASLIMYNWRWAATMSFTSVFGCWSINYMAMELENPFSNAYNNLPLASYQDDANRVLMTMLKPGLQDAPQLVRITNVVEWPKQRETEELVLQGLVSKQTEPTHPAMTARVSQLGALIGEDMQDGGFPPPIKAPLEEKLIGQEQLADDRSFGSDYRDSERSQGPAAVPKDPGAQLEDGIGTPEVTIRETAVGNWQLGVTPLDLSRLQPGQSELVQSFMEALGSSAKVREAEHVALLDALRVAARRAEEQLLAQTNTLTELVRAMDKVSSTTHSDL